MLLRQRGGIVSAVTRVESYINSINSASPDESEVLRDASYLRSQQQLVQRMKEKYILIQTQIIQTCTIPVRRVQEETSLSDFIRRCDEIMGTIQGLIGDDGDQEETPGIDLNTSVDMLTLTFQELMRNSDQRHQTQMNAFMDRLTSTLASRLPDNTNTPAPTNQTTYINTSSNGKLPEIPLPSFSGKYSDWFPFKDRFESLMSGFSNMSGSRKLDYLKGCVKGDAESLIKNIPSTNENYNVAWELLISRFERKNEIVADHIRSFYNMPKVTSNTFKSINEISNTFSETIMALDAMQVRERDPWVVQFALDRLDSESKVLWGRECKGALPTIEKFKSFLAQRRIDFLNAPPPTTRSHAPPPIHPPRPRPSSSGGPIALAVSGATSSSMCGCCNEANHPLYQCPKFLADTPTQRYETVRALNLCRNCLAGHMTNTCTFRKCPICRKSHSRHLHDYFVAQENSTPSQEATETPSASVNIISTQPSAESPSVLPVTGVYSLSSTAHLPKVFLATLMVDVLSENHQKTTCRAVLDSGAQVSVMTTQLAQKLKLPKLPANLSVVGVGGQSYTIKHKVKVTIFSRCNDVSYTFDCYVIPNIMENIPSWNVNASCIPIPPEKDLADPDWSVQRPIDLLISGDPYWASWLGGTVHLGPGLPQMKETVFGYVIVGEHKVIQEPYQSSAVLAITVKDSTAPLQSISTDAIEEEEKPPDLSVIKEQREAKTHSRTTSKWSSEARFVVRLPFKPDPSKFRCSHPLAVRQFIHLVKGFAKNLDCKPLKDCRFSHSSIVLEKPTDVILRGCTPNQMATTDIWCHGPERLRSDHSAWSQRFSIAPSVREEVEVLSEIVKDTIWYEQWTSRHSSISRIKCIMAHVLRLLHNFSPEANQVRLGSLTDEEMEGILRILFNTEKYYHFHKLKSHLEKGPICNSEWRFLASLDSFVDDEGLIRVGGCLQSVVDSFDFKYSAKKPCNQDNNSVGDVTGVDVLQQRKKLRGAFMIK